MSLAQEMWWSIRLDSRPLNTWSYLTLSLPPVSLGIFKCHLHACKESYQKWQNTALMQYNEAFCLNSSSRTLSPVPLFFSVYRLKFCRTYPEMKTKTQEWKTVVGGILIFLGLTGLVVWWQKAYGKNLPVCPHFFPSTSHNTTSTWQKCNPCKHFGSVTAGKAQLKLTALTMTVLLSSRASQNQLANMPNTKATEVTHLNRPQALAFQRSRCLLWGE